MLLITKKECETLVGLGYKFGRDLFHTIGKGSKKTYYATESEKVLFEINKIRKMI